MSKKQKHPPARHSKPKTTSQKTSSVNKAKPSHRVQRKERGVVLTILLIIMLLHGIIAAYVFYTYRVETAILDRPWILTLMIIHSLANAIAAAGIWFWKKWALYIYAGSTILALIVGLVSVGIWSVFYVVLPLAIVGWVLRTKWKYFET